MFTVGCPIRALELVCHAPEVARIALGPIRKVAVAGMDQVFASAVRALSTNVDGMSAGIALFAAFDAATSPRFQ